MTMWSSSIKDSVSGFMAREFPMSDNVNKWLYPTPLLMQRKGKAKV